MKTFQRLLCVLVIGGLPAANLFGQFDYAETSPNSADGDAAADTYAVGGQLNGDELAQQFGADTSSAGTASNSNSVTPKQRVGVEVGGGTFEYGGQKAELYTVKIPYSRQLSERGTLELLMPVTAVVFDKVLAGIKDAKTYGIGLNAGYAWQAFLKKDNVPYRWKLTPSAGLYYRDSTDLNEGEWVFNTGFSSSFAWQFAPGWVVNMGNSISFAWNNGIRHYPDPIRDDQQTLKNGLQLYRMLDRWTLAAYFTDTEALNNMIVDSYQTYGIWVGYKLTKTSSIKATFYREEGNGGYKSTQGSLGSNWQF